MKGARLRQYEHCFGKGELNVTLNVLLTMSINLTLTYPKNSCVNVGFNRQDKKSAIWNKTGETFSLLWATVLSSFVNRSHKIH